MNKNIHPIIPVAEFLEKSPSSSRKLTRAGLGLAPNNKEI